MGNKEEVMQVTRTLEEEQVTDLLNYAIECVKAGWSKQTVLDHAYKHLDRLEKDRFCPYCGNCPRIGLFEELTPKVSVGIDLDRQDRVFVEASSNKDGGHFKKRVGWTHCPYCGRELNNGQK